jgi:predicted nucleic acid-binding protein
VPSMIDLDDLSTTHDLTPYDAVYFELARRRKLPLATLDAALIKAARSAKLALLTESLD